MESEELEALHRIEALGLSTSPSPQATIIPPWPLPGLFPEDIATMIFPGAGLAQTRDEEAFLEDSDAIFDGIFNLPTPPAEALPKLVEKEISNANVPHVRTYTCDQDL